MISTDPRSGVPHAPRLAQVHYELLTLGDELLLGLTPNGHLSFIGEELARRGVMLRRNVTITDDASAIAHQFRESWSSADVVITTGGLGPTCDDRTRESIAGVLGLELVFDHDIERTIAERFALLGRKMTPNNLKQAYRFGHGEVLPNANGTAPGLWIEKDGKVLCMLPGPPNELQPMFRDQVLPRLSALGLLLDCEAYVQVRSAGVGESLLETKLQPIFDRYGRAIHRLPRACRPGRLPPSCPNGDLDLPQLHEIASECAPLLGDDFIGFGHDPRPRSARTCSARRRRGSPSRKRRPAAFCPARLRTSAEQRNFSPAPASVTRTTPACSRSTSPKHPPAAWGRQRRGGGCHGDRSRRKTRGRLRGRDHGFFGALLRIKGKPCRNDLSRPARASRRLVEAAQLPGPRRTVKPRAVNAALDWLRRELVRAGWGVPANAERAAL